MRKKTQALVYRTLLNAWPCIVGTGGRVTHLSEDFTRLTVELPLTWRTRNAFGTIYGGSMYASTDPFYTLMLMRLLGKSYVVWDKGCTIRFKRPAKVTLHAEFRITPEMLDDVKRAVSDAGSAEFTWTVQYKGADGVIHAEFDKVLYVASKSFYEQRQKSRASASAPA